MGDKYPECEKCQFDITRNIAFPCHKCNPSQYMDRIAEDLP